MLKSKEMDISEGGYLLIDKPVEWTSFDVVKKLRNLSRVKKIGHAGTLDPLASGMLIICYGRYTKMIEHFQSLTKEYTGCFHIGATTESYDGEQPINARFPTEHITQESIENAVETFRGEIEQVPPVHSAVKIKGKRAYEHARKGEEVVLKSRKVMIEQFEVDAANFPDLDFVIRCSKGTYIRSLARDLGRALESGAYMTALRRTAIGDFHVDRAVQINDIKTPEDFFKLAHQLTD